MLLGLTPFRSNVSGRATLQKPLGGAQCLVDVEEVEEILEGVVEGGMGEGVQESTGRGGGFNSIIVIIATLYIFF